jgi:hypothetical protein
MDRIQEQVRLDLSWSQDKSKKYYDAKRESAPVLKQGDCVYLKRRTIGKNEYNIVIYKGTLLRSTLKSFSFVQKESTSILINIGNKSKVVR